VPFIVIVFSDHLTTKDQNIAFFAYLGQDMIDPSTGTTVVFNEVMTNTGNHYDPIHGVFRTRCHILSTFLIGKRNTTSVS
jgi:hypothetical protein